MRKLLLFLIAATLLLSSLHAAVAQDTITLELWHRWSGNNEKVLNQVIADFEAKHPNVKINVTAKAGEYFELLQQMLADIAAGNPPPDIFVGGYNLLNYIAEELQPIPVKELAPDESTYAAFRERFTDAIYSLGSYADQQVGVPYAMSNMVMYVNLDIFKAAGLTKEDIPVTWEALMEVSKTIKEKTGKYTIAIQTPDTWADQALVFSAGGEMLSPDGKKVAFNDEGAIRALTMWQELVNQKYHPIATDPEMLSGFQAGEIAMHPTTIMKLNGIQSAAAFELVVAQCPAFDGQTKQLPAGGAALISFTKDAAKVPAVWSFLDYSTSKEGMETFVNTGYLSVIKEEIAPHPGQEAAYAQTVFARPWASWPGGSAGLEIEQRYLQVRNELIFNKLDVKETLDKLVNECNELL